MLFLFDEIFFKLSQFFPFVIVRLQSSHKQLAAGASFDFNSCISGIVTVGKAPESLVGDQREFLICIFGP